MWPNLALWQNNLWRILVCCVFLSFTISLSACQPASPAATIAVADTVPYALTSPSVIIYLSNEDLREISGLSPTKEEGVFCAIADERGEIYFVRGDGGGVVLRTVNFLEKGDFEGVEAVGETLYAVKSNGNVYEVSRWKNNRKPCVKVYETPLKKSNDIEGLGFDPRRNTLLIACKQDPESDTTRCIMAFDLNSKQLHPKPAYSIDPKQVQALVPTLPGEKSTYFSPSGVAIHPKTNDVYILSSSKKCLVVLDYNTGKIKYASRLDKQVLPQPEGIAFDKAGNLFLSSEGKKGEALLVRFNTR
jgi:uncharacterized protein YjiK